MKVGDWVTAHSKGFFQINKILKRYYDESHRGGILNNNPIGAEIPDPIVVLKKGFNSNLKPSISWDTCSLSLCNRINDDVLQIIQDKFRTDDKFKKRFESYIIPPIATLLNFGFNSNKDMLDITRIETEITNGMTFLEIKNRMNSDFNYEYPHNSTIQFVNYDHEINGKKELIYRDIKLF